MNWISGRSKQYKKGTKARQLEFFARRRMTANYIVAAEENPSIDKRPELPGQGIKRIRGSFDVFALVGKEEFLGAKSWLDVVQDGSGQAEPRTMGLTYSNISLAPATYGSQPESRESEPDTCSATSQGVMSPGPAHT